MDINTLRGISTIFVAIAFISICVWAYAPKRKKRFEEAANLPFADEPEIIEKHQSDSDEKQQG